MIFTGHPRWCRISAINSSSFVFNKQRFLHPSPAPVLLSTTIFCASVPVLPHLTLHMLDIRGTQNQNASLWYPKAIILLIMQVDYSENITFCWMNTSNMIFFVYPGFLRHHFRWWNQCLPGPISSRMVGWCWLMEMSFLICKVVIKSRSN